ncbi:MAG: alpha/beta fold hydrolase [Bacteriovoracaceae bacterium]|nr:alpha/beta fold hydrolase [Bacteriovoracaceae bacterium]
MRFVDKLVPSFDQERLHLSIAELGHPVWLVLTHGIGEYSGRYHQLSQFLCQYFNVCIYDLRGHGRSSGERAYVNDFFDFSRDLNTVLAHLKENFKMKNFILYGHSMGGLITSEFMQNYHLIEGNVIIPGEFYPQLVFLSAPAVAPAGWLGKIVQNLPLSWWKALSNKNIHFSLSGLLDLFYLSHDYRVFEEYMKDPLNNMKLSVKLLLEVVVHSKQVYQKSLRVQCPLHCIAGTEDRLISYSSIAHYFQTIEPHGVLHVIPNGYHELHNEVDRYRRPYLEILKSVLLPLVNKNFV